MKTILFLDHFNRHGGAQEYVLDIAKRLRTMDVNVFIPAIMSDSLKCIADGLHDTGFSILSNSFKSLSFYSNLLKNIFQVRRFSAQMGVDIIHCNSIPALVLAKFSRLKNQRVLFTCHDCNLGKLKVSLIQICADKIICVSGTVKQYLEKNGIRQEMTIIFNGFSDIANEKAVKIPKKPINIGLIGRLERWKGVHLFINAAETCLKKVKEDVQFHIIGYAEDQQYYHELQQLIISKEKIVFKPFQSNKKIIYSNLDVVVNASNEIEPFGRTLVEAGIFGLPVIGPSIGGPAEIIKDGETGLIFEAGNAHDLSEKMDLLIHTESLRKKMGIKGRNHCLQEFSLEKTCTELIEFYASL